MCSAGMTILEKDNGKDGKHQRVELRRTPYMKEVRHAMRRVKSGKAVGTESSIADFFNRPVKPAAVSDNYIRYNNGTITKRIIPKSKCKNYREISLPGQVFGRPLIERIAEVIKNQFKKCSVQIKDAQFRFLLFRRSLKNI